MFWLLLSTLGTLSLKLLKLIKLYNWYEVPVTLMQGEWYLCTYEAWESFWKEEDMKCQLPWCEGNYTCAHMRHECLSGKRKIWSASYPDARGMILMHIWGMSVFLERLLKRKPVLWSTQIKVEQNNLLKQSIISFSLYRKKNCA